MKDYIKLLLSFSLIICSCSNRNKRDLLIGKWSLEYDKPVDTASETRSNFILSFNENGRGKREFIVNGVPSNIKFNIFSLEENQLIITEGKKKDSLYIVELTNEVLRFTKPNSDTFSFLKIK